MSEGNRREHTAASDNDSHNTMKRQRCTSSSSSSDSCSPQSLASQKPGSPREHGSPHKFSREHCSGVPHLSARSTHSMEPPHYFNKEDFSTPPGLSARSTHSMEPPHYFNKEDFSTPPGLSARSTHSMEPPHYFNKEDFSTPPGSTHSMEPPHYFNKEDFSTPHGPDRVHSGLRVYQEGFAQEIDSIFKNLEAAIGTFASSELRRFQNILTQDQQEASERQREHEEQLEQDSSAREGMLKMVLFFLRQMNHPELADSLEKSHLGELGVCQYKLKANLRRRCELVFEGIAKHGSSTLLSRIYTELYIVEGGVGDVCTQHEVRKIEDLSRRPFGQERSIRCNEIFEPEPDENRQVRTVLTKGVAGIGKTVSTQKFTLDWAKGRANHRIELIFSLPFRELNLMKDRILSFTEFINRSFLDPPGIHNVSPYRVLFIFDGLDECRLPLDFENNEVLRDVRTPNTVDVLMTNLIRGNLLPSAQVWITSRPAAANNIPAECVDRVTEVRGFNDPQKEEYIRKRICDQNLAENVIAHLKLSRSLFIMCHIPVFTWISSTVLERLLVQSQSKEIPKTLTQMYSHFLTFNRLIKQQKYYQGLGGGQGGGLGGGQGSNEGQINTDREIVLKLGKLAYDQLEKGNLIFYAEDLRDCNLDIQEASVFSGLCTQVFREEHGLFQEKVFCFVHLSIQEFLAALYALFTFSHADVNVMLERKKAETNRVPEETTRLIQLSLIAFLRDAVDKALESKNGHFDLFLRFLLGLSQKSNQKLVQNILNLRDDVCQTSTDEIILYIKEKIRDSPSPERCINLFHCLSELNDHSLIAEIQSFLSSGKLPESRLSPSQWAALVFVLLTSEEVLDVFELKKYSRSEEGLFGLLPVIKASRTAQVNSCNLTERCCGALVSLLSSTDSQLRELDLSDNDLQDAGLEKLSSGIASPHCKLETLRLSFCGITGAGCGYLVAALRSNPSHLRELDLTYNHPGDSGVQLLSGLLHDPMYSLKKLSLDHDGECWLKSGLRKYACHLTLDPNTACRFLVLSEGNRKMTRGSQVQPYPEHPERFKNWGQVLCREPLAGRCYWEAEWTGKWAGVGVAYRGISRKGEGNDCALGYNPQSWSLRIYDDCFNAWHDKKGDPIAAPWAPSRRVGVFLDWPAGTLSFYSVTSGTLSHLHTFRTAFSEPLYAGFRLWHDDVSVALCTVPAAADDTE